VDKNVTFTHMKNKYYPSIGVRPVFLVFTVANEK